MATSSSDDFSVFVLASDLGIDARPFLTNKEREQNQENPEPENWHDCSQDFISDEDFSDLDLLQFFTLQGSDKSGNRIFRIVGKYFPAQVVSGERLKKYIFHKICSELPEGPLCIVYMHSTVQKEDNSPGVTILRWIYEELPADIKDRLQTVYFIHPGLRSRLVFATLGRFFLSGGLYWKIKYVSRLQYLWEDIKKGEIEIPEFVQNHDNILENRPLTDYGIEPDPFHLSEMPMTAYSFGSYLLFSWTRCLNRKIKRCLSTEGLYTICSSPWFGMIMHLPTRVARQRKEITDEFFHYRHLTQAELWDRYSAYINSGLKLRFRRTRMSLQLFKQGEESASLWMHITRQGKNWTPTGSFLTTCWIPSSETNGKASFGGWLVILFFCILFIFGYIICIVF